MRLIPAHEFAKMANVQMMSEDNSARLNRMKRIAMAAGVGAGGTPLTSMGGRGISRTWARHKGRSLPAKLTGAELKERAFVGGTGTSLGQLVLGSKGEKGLTMSDLPHGMRKQVRDHRAQGRPGTLNKQGSGMATAGAKFSPMSSIKGVGKLRPMGPSGHKVTGLGAVEKIPGVPSFGMGSNARTQVPGYNFG